MPYSIFHSLFVQRPYHTASAWHARTRDLTLQLVHHLTVTNSLGEATGAAVIRDILAAVPYFQRYPAHLKVLPIAGDPLGRANVVALVRGTGEHAVVLTGHYDVVSTANYGALEPWANQPDELLSRLMQDLRDGEQTDADARALIDLESGNYLPGRGALDMKSGLAAGIAVLEHFAARSMAERPGSVLFVATPDEEDRSSGMRDIAPQLPDLAAAWAGSERLTIRAALNLDAAGDLTDGREGQVIFLGSVGKLLLSAFVVGRDTHAGYPFDGINANFLASCLTREMECNTDFCDEAQGAVAPPPTTLKQEDLKVGYDVTTPGAAWTCYNVLTYQTSPEDVLARFRRVAEQALGEGIEHLSRAARAYAGLSGATDTFTREVAQVMTFAELRAAAHAHGGDDVLAHAATLARRLSADPSYDLPAISRDVTEFLWRASHLQGPAVVLGFASLPYPAVALDASIEGEARLRRIVEKVSEESQERFGTHIGVRHFFQGISDMSFIGRVRSESLRYVAEQTPSWGSAFQWTVSAEVTPGLPTINVGPWGRDYHQRLERVFVPYSFGVLPEIIVELTERVLRRD